MKTRKRVTKTGTTKKTAPLCETILLSVCVARDAVPRKSETDWHVAQGHAKVKLIGTSHRDALLIFA